MDSLCYIDFEKNIQVPLRCLYSAQQNPFFKKIVVHEKFTCTLIPIHHNCIQIHFFVMIHLKNINTCCENLQSQQNPFVGCTKGLTKGELLKGLSVSSQVFDPVASFTQH